MLFIKSSLAIYGNPSAPDAILMTYLSPLVLFLAFQTVWPAISIINFLTPSSFFHERTGFIRVDLQSELFHKIQNILRKLISSLANNNRSSIQMRADYAIILQRFFNKYSPRCFLNNVTIRIRELHRANWSLQTQVHVHFLATVFEHFHVSYAALSLNALHIELHSGIDQSFDQALRHNGIIYSVIWTRSGSNNFPLSTFLFSATQTS